MPDAIPHKFLCECGQVLINHYPSQIAIKNIFYFFLCELMKKKII